MPARFAAALLDHQQGRLAAAEAGYRHILAAQPRHADSLHLLGVVARQTGRSGLAIELIGRAIALQPRAAAWHANLGNALGDLGRWAEAAACYRRAIALQPAHAASHYNLGNALRGLGRPEAAIDSFAEAIRLAPAFAAAHSNLGTALREAGRLPEAIAAGRQAVALQPGLAEAHDSLGSSLHQAGELEEAIASHRQAVALRPDQAGAWNNLANALRDQGDLAQAIACHRTALGLAPESADSHNNLGAALAEQGALDEAVACYRAAIALRPAFAEAHSNLGNVLRQQGHGDAAVACYRTAIAARPEFAPAHFHLGMALLARGAFAEGWAEYEWRWTGSALRDSHRNFPQPQWRGEPAAGQTLLIHAEQGFGDTLQFCRYAPLAAERGLRVILEVPRPLLRLMQSLPGVAELVASGDPLPRFDLHCPMVSLPLAFRTTLDTIPQANAYLHADPAAMAAWAARLGAGPRIGLVWAGSARSHLPFAAAVDRRRSLAPELLAPLLRIPGATFFSLQKDGPRAPAGFGLIDHMDEMHDFADTAALVANLDLVISVDTAMAHLAAALGRPVWMLDRFDPCWRWLTDRRDSPWYPTLRLYRQNSAGEWAGVIAEVLGDVPAFIESKRVLF